MGRGANASPFPAILTSAPLPASLAATYYVFVANVVLLLAVLAVPRIDDASDSWPPPLAKEV